MRRRPLLLGLTAAVCTAAALVLSLCGPAPHRPPATAPGTGGGPIATFGGPFTAGPVLPPPSGALLGAWVKPDLLTQPARVAAVGDLETALGRPLDFVNTYRRFDEAFPTESDRTFTRTGRPLMLSWAIDDTRLVTSGAQDAAISRWATRVRDFG